MDQLIAQAPRLFAPSLINAAPMLAALVIILVAAVATIVFLVRRSRRHDRATRAHTGNNTSDATSAHRR